MKMPSRTVDRVARLVRWHMYDKDASTRSGKMLLFTAHNIDIIDDLAVLIAADRAGRGPTGLRRPCVSTSFAKSS